MPPTPPTSLSENTLRHALQRGVWTVALAAITVGLGVLALAQTDVGAGAIADLAARAQVAQLLATGAFMALAFLFIALRWRALMPPDTGAGAAGLTAIMSAALLLNFAVPGPVGELGGAWFASRRYRISLSDALASGVAARVVGLTTTALMAAAFGLIFNLAIPPGYESLVAIAAVMVGLGGAALAGLAAKPLWWKAASAWTLGRINGGSVLSRGARALDALIGELADALAQVLTRGWGPYARAAGWAIAAHTVIILGIAFAAHSLGASPSLGGLAFTYAASTAGTIALFALPGSQVGWDALFFTLLVATAGVSPTDALAIALFVRLQQISIMIAGAAATAWLMRKG